MAAPSVTYTFSNSTTADATQVNQNFTDLVNGLSDGTKDLSINALTCAGTATLNGHVTLGNSSADDLTFTGSVASTIAVKTNATYDFGAATLAMRSFYIGQGTKSIRLLAPTITNSYTITLPVDVLSTAKSVMTFDTSGVATFENRGTMSVVAKTGNYTATLADELILCSGAAFTITLPAASTSTGKVLTIKKTDSTAANIITIDGNASETIDGATTQALTSQYESMKITCDGSNWQINARDARDYKAASTDTKTPAGSSNYHQMTNNSITLTPGIWTLYHRAAFDNSGSPVYSDAFYTLTTANGADSGSEPANINASGSITILSTYSGGNRLGRIVPSTASQDVTTDMPIRIRVTAAVTIYIVPFSSQTTSAQARIWASLWAERVG